MTFPDQLFSDIGSYCDEYGRQYSAAFASIDRSALAAAVLLLSETFAADKTLYCCGNGGSTAIANHLLCDFAKGIQTDTEQRPKVVSLSSCTEIITAIANDMCYEDVFLFQFKTAARPGDLLLTISSSGDSENVVRAVQWAKDNDIRSIALTGFDGGRSASLATVNLHVQGDNYGVVEDCHQAIMHMLSQYLRLASMPESLITQRKF